MICKHCGAEIPEWLDFCPECMTPVAGEAAAQAETQAPAAAQEAPAPVEEAPKKAAQAVLEDEEEDDVPAEVYQSPQRPKRSRRRKSRKRGGNRLLWFLFGALICAAVVSALILTGVLQFGRARGASANPADPIAEQGCQAPEDVLTSYAESMKNGDLSGMLSTYAAESRLTHLSTSDAYAPDFENDNDYKIWAVGAMELQAAGTPLSKAVASEKARIDIINIIISQLNHPLLSANSHYTYDSDNSIYLIQLESEDDMSDYLKQLATSDLLADMEIGKAFEVTDKLSDDGKAAYEEYMQYVTSYYNAEDARFFYIEVKINGVDYLLGMLLVQYDGVWYDAMPTLYGVNLKAEYLANSQDNGFGGLVPVAAIQDWV